MSNYAKEKVKLWIACAGVRALKTFAQTAVAMVPVGVTVQEVGWLTVGSTALLAAVLSVLTSVAGIPEVDDGSALPAIMEED